MASLTILNASGDTTIEWNEAQYAAGDPAAAAAVAEAERLFAEARAAGAEAFRVRTGELAQRVTTLEPATGEDVMIIPRMVGG
jgi:4-hydroxyphenylpyruvate dioxygenase-like putative hemolysin